MFSECDNITYILNIVDQLKGRLRILDVGCGWGKWGFLLRGWLDVDKNGPDRREWIHKIDACEIFEPCITPMHRYIYDQIILEDFRNLFQDAGLIYDIIIMGNCLEFVPKQDGIETIIRFLKYAKNLIISARVDKNEQEEYYGNAAMRRYSFWMVQDFQNIGKCDVQQHNNLYTICYTR